MVAEYSSANDPIDATQLIEMQTKLTFQEDAMQQLSDVVAQQQQDIMSLQGQMKQLITELNAVLGDLEQGGLAKSPVDQKPPHY